MHSFKIPLVSLLSFLFGCNAPDKSELFQKKDGSWYYRDEVIAGSDAQSFEALTEHYAKDKNHVYYCDTYRSSQDYFTTKRNRIQIIERAEPSTFKYLKDGYARDKANMFFEGAFFAVKDIDSFQILDYSFAKDRISGYYMRVEIAGSDGGSFISLDNHYSKDKDRVYYSDIEPGNSNAPPAAKTIVLQGAVAGSFDIIDINYAADAKHVYYKSNVLTDAVHDFQVLQYDYAKTKKRVYYRGTPISQADAPSFTILDTPNDSADARDQYSLYNQGKKIKH